MTSQLTYLACPYSNPDDAIRAGRFASVNRIAATLMQAGHLIFSPISHTRPIALAGDLPHGFDFWEQYDTAFLKACKAIIVLTIDGWRESVGVQAEIKIAGELGIPIRYIDECGQFQDGCDHDAVVYASPKVQVGANGRSLIVDPPATTNNQEGGTNMPVKILIKFAHGLGDVTQATVILKHLRKYRPDWVVDFRCGRGKHTAAVGLCNKVWHDAEPEPPASDYSTVVEPGFWENYNHERDQPNSKVINCLKEVFGIAWDPALGRYEVRVRDAALRRAMCYLQSIGCQQYDDGGFNAIIIHYEGNTSAHRKNLRHWQAASLCEMAIRAGRIPIILDWDKRSPLPDGKRIYNPPTGAGDIWGGFGSGDAETIAALIGLAEAYVGVDSGPGKIASATDTPSLICWTGHHPLQFHDPAPNTMHLVPDDHRHMNPLNGDEQMLAFFTAYYQHATYTNGAHGLVREAQRWLGSILGCEEVVPTIQYVTPNGIGDVIWALHKIRAIANAEHAGAPIDIILSGNPGNDIDHRSTHFLRRFPFVRSATVMDVPVIVDPGNPNDEAGRYRYEPDRVVGGHHFLCPNATLERGERLEAWQPDYPVDWSVIDEFDWSNTERGTEQGRKLGKFAAFYLGPETGNVDEGHNRGFLWEPSQWCELAQALIARGCRIAVVGAHYDRSYWERYIREGVGERGMDWVDLIGRFEIGETFALLRESKVLVSYQCGLAICHHYFGGNAVSWWRPDGDSIHPHRLVSFNEGMRASWTNPKYADRYYGAVYKRETVADLIRVVDERGWVK